MVRKPARAASRGARNGWVFIFIVGCRPAGEDDAGHPGEEKSAQITVWSDRFEAFIEHSAAIAGSPTRFVTHLTDTVMLEPRREGPIRFILRGGTGAPVEYVEDAPVRAGIYLPELTFPAPGEWAVEIRIPTDSGESVALLPPITVHPSRAEADRAAEPEAPAGISFRKEQQWRVRTKVEIAGRRRLVERLRVPGIVAARPASRASVAAPLAGRLLAPPGAAFPSLGARVEAGQALALLQPPFPEFLTRVLEAEAAVARARLGLELAELTFARVEKLASQQFKSWREREEAEFALHTARANHDAAVALKEAYRLTGAVFVKPSGEGEEDTPDLPAIQLRAPISGVVTQVAAAAGEHVPSDRVAFSLLDAAWVFIEARVPESEIGRIASSPGAAYELPGEPGRLVHVLDEAEGRLVLVGTAVDPATRTIPLVYEVKNLEGRLRIGMAFPIYLETRRAEDALAVPESAVVEEDGRPVAFVQLGGETFEKRFLSLGIRDRGFVQVITGLKESERVVTKEAYAIRLASVATSIPAGGHEH